MYELFYTARVRKQASHGTTHPHKSGAQWPVSSVMLKHHAVPIGFPGRRRVSDLYRLDLREAMPLVMAAFVPVIAAFSLCLFIVSR